MRKYDLLFYLLHLSAILLFFFFFYIMKKKRKSQIHYIFLSTLALLFVWCISIIVETYILNIKGVLIISLEYLTYIGACFVPVTLLLIGLIFARTKIKFSWKILLLFVIPVITNIIVWTNEYHHLFYEKFSINLAEIVYGRYFIVHIVYSYTCVVIGLYYLLYFSIKNSGFFSKQSILIFAGSIVPFVVNISVTLKIIFLNAYSTPITFSFAVICYLLAVLKYEFLNIAPIALQSVVDRISDSFIVVNEELNVMDYNKTFVDTFGEILNIRRNSSLVNVLCESKLDGMDRISMTMYINEARYSKKSITFEKHFKTDSLNKYFTMEVTPIISQENFIGTIILLKDITQSKKDLETIKENQAILMEQERLASLGQLMGGIAHNLRTPIMSLAGGIEALKELVVEYDEAVVDINVTKEDHHEIAMEMLSWLEKMKPYCSYMSDIITTVKGQTVQLSDSSTISFTLGELTKRIDVLMKHELKKYHCILNIDFQVDMHTQLKGEVNSLVQIFDNIIINAIQSYDGDSGVIDFKIYKNESNIVFSLRDYGTGIQSEIKERLFKEMVTTKGKNGTGLGLFMSYSTIKGRFGGNMWFESEKDKGTTFYISIPFISTIV